MPERGSFPRHISGSPLAKKHYKWSETQHGIYFREILPEKLVKRRQYGEKRFIKSHCCASCGVAVGNKFWEERGKKKRNKTGPRIKYVIRTYNKEYLRVRGTALPNFVWNQPNTCTVCVYWPSPKDERHTGQSKEIICSIIIVQKPTSVQGE